MKRFVWRLQRVLEIKTKEEEKKREELLKIAENLAQTRAELITQQKVLRGIISEIRGENPRRRLGRQEFFIRYSATIDERIKILQQKASQIELQQREKIAEVLKIKRFNEGLEKLRAEAKIQFIKEQEKLEQKESDESATILFTRNMLFHNT